MKRLLLISLLIWGFALPHCAYAENEDSFLDSAGKFFSDAWNSAGELWNEASNATGNKIRQAWTDFSGAASDAWNKAGTYSKTPNCA